MLQQFRVEEKLSTAGQRKEELVSELEEFKVDKKRAEGDTRSG